MPSWAWIAIAVGAVLALLVFLLLVRRQLARRRTARLHETFGPEYGRVAAAAPSKSEAEAELEARADRHDKLELRDLPDDSRERYLESWRRVQARFVDDPRGAVGGADTILESVLRERGYSIDDDFDRLVGDLSVDHPDVVDRYREGHRLAQTPENDPAATENLRAAMQHYRALFDELVRPAQVTRS